MDIEVFIQEYRTKAKNCFDWGAYQRAREYAQVADWLQELIETRERVAHIEGMATAND